MARRAPHSMNRGFRNRRVKRSKYRTPEVPSESTKDEEVGEGEETTVAEEEDLSFLNELRRKLGLRPI